MKLGRISTIRSFWTNEREPNETDCFSSTEDYPHSPRFKIPRGECGGMEVGEKELEDELESEQHHELKPGWSWFSCLFPSVRGLRVCDP